MIDVFGTQHASIVWREMEVWSHVRAAAGVRSTPPYPPIYLEQAELDRLRLERLEQNISWEDELHTSLADETRYERLYRLRRRAWSQNRGSNSTAVRACTASRPSHGDG